MSGKPRRPPLLAWSSIVIAVFIVSLMALMVLQYRMPPAARSLYGLNHEAVHIFQIKLLGHGLSSMGLRAYTLSFRLLLIIVWVSYALTVVLGLLGNVPKRRPIITLIALMSISLALLWPASLSYDSFAYLAYARTKALYGLNPYTVSPDFLERVGDPTAWSIPRRMLSSYGSVWTVLSIAVVALLKNAGLWWQEVAIKLIEAGALIGAALAGRRWLLGGLMLGLYIGVKLITLAVLPWVIMEYVRSKGNRNKAMMGVALVVLALAPAILCYLPFMSDGLPVTGLLQRWAWGSYMQTGSSMARTAVRALPLLVIFAGLTFWLWRDRKPGAWLTAWAPFSLALILLTSRVWFPWYFIWPLAISLACWDWLHVRLSACCRVMTFLLSLSYSIAAR